MHVKLIWLALLLSASAWAGTAQLSWTAPTQNTDGSPLTDLTGYALHRRCGTGTRSQIATTNAATRTYTDTVADGQTCWWSLTAIATSGISTYTNEVTKAFLVPLPGSTAATFTWVTRTPSVSVSKIGTTGNHNDATDTSIAGSATIAVQTGDLIVVLGKHEGATTTVTATDNAAGGSNTYTALTYDRHANDDIGIRLAWAVAKASETLTFTVNFAATRTYRGIVVWVFRSTTGTWELHNEVIAQAAGGEPSAGTLTAGGTDGAAVAGFGMYYAPGAQTPGTDWAEDYDVSWLVYGESRILTNETTMTADMTDVNGGPWLAAAASFKVVVAAGSGARISNPAQQPMIRGPM